MERSAFCARLNWVPVRNLFEGTGANARRGEGMARTTNPEPGSRVLPEICYFSAK